MYKIILTKQAQKDLKEISRSHFKSRTKEIIEALAEDPYSRLHSFEKLIYADGSVYSRRINVKHRLVYQIDEKLKIVKIISMWTHYEKLV